MTPSPDLPLEKCANGDGNPVCPPSKVICRECMDKISRFLESELARLRGAYD